MSASPNLKCGLCNEFLVNAVTVAGCMHSFCEECLLKNLSVSGICPTKGCKKNVDKNGYRRDSTLQMLVYKFMPQMFFESAEKGNRGNVDASNRKIQRELAQASCEICDPDELLSICLEFVPAPAVTKPDEEATPTNPSSSSFKAEPPLKKMKKMREHREVQQSFRRFFRCAAKVPIRVVRRLLETKLFLTDQFSVHFISDRDFQDIPDDVTLRTLVLDGGFDRTRPFRLFFTLIPTVNDDAPPVLDAEAMPCLMPEAPVHQEPPSTIQPPGQLQPVQLVSPVVPALTVSLSTDIYGHSAPIITPQYAPRKRRKLSDPKKSPTEKSPTTVAHPTPLAPNMLVGPLIRPMFIAQPPFIHRSPPNVHISMPYAQQPQSSNPVDGTPSKQCAPVGINDINVDQPPQLQREDPVATVVPPLSMEPSSSSFTSIQKVPNIPQIPPPMLPRLEPNHQVVPLPPSQQSLLPSQQSPPTSQQQPPPSHPPHLPSPQPPPSSQQPLASSQQPPSPLQKSLDIQPSQSGYVPHEGASKMSKAEKRTKPKPPPLPENPSMSMDSRALPKAISSALDQPVPSHPPLMNGTAKGSEAPPRLESMASHPTQQLADKKPSSRANSSQQNGLLNNGVSKVKTNTAPTLPTIPAEQLRSGQTALPLLGADVRSMPVLPRKLEEAPLPMTSTNFDPRMELAAAARLSTGSLTSSDHASPVPALPNASTVTAPMDFRRMATLNKQSLGRTLQAVLSSGRADVTKNTVAPPGAGTGDVASGGSPMDARSSPLNGKIKKEAAVDLRFPNSKSLST
ncbi:Polycomb group protein Psc [Trichostrongylus colubriformis]|uniref:Polycomb group protein Psc n=1 Tax=Trichostrongylus colubriformis TaxID=6319 RepID=A0AAN8ISZ3_TRICO